LGIGQGNPTHPLSVENNGNLLRQVHHVPLAGGGRVSHVNDYSYDSLNRVTSIFEQYQSQNDPLIPVFNQTFLYDRWGNQRIDQVGTGMVTDQDAWVEDSLPTGAITGTHGGDSWAWMSSSYNPYSGTAYHSSTLTAGFHQHYFSGATQTLQLNAGDRLYAYVYLDAANPPSEIMFQFHENGSWEHRAYWGANDIDFGTNGTNNRRYMGPLPPAGQWVRLEVPASLVGLEEKTVNGMSFTLYGGKASWDKVGKGRLVNHVAINEKAFTIDAATNRLTTVDGAAMSYDPAGNQINDGSGERTYDGENRMVKAYNGAVLVSQYIYDANGKRVKRIIGGQEKWQVYGIGGELLAEYAAGAAPSAAQKEYGYRNGQLLVVWDGSETVDRRLQWLVQDHLGSTRMVVDRSGSLGGIRRHDFLPFGEELPAGVGIRTASIGYGDDSVRQKFTGQERDDETGLDYFGARYFSSVQGRFTSPDPIPMTPVRQLDPQQINLYQYSRNNPLAYSDPTGMDIIRLGEHTDEEIKRRLAEIAAKLKQEGITEQQKADLEKESNNLMLEQEGNKIVSDLLQALDSIGERNGLKVSDFALSTDRNNDFKDFEAAAKTKKDKAGWAYFHRVDPFAFVVPGSKDIYFNTQNNSWKVLVIGKGISPIAGEITLPDLTKSYSTNLRHEQAHRDRQASERTAYTIQLRVLEKYGPGAFINKGAYNEVRNFINNQIRTNKR
jgi:RHS repeat-associated protein